MIKKILCNSLCALLLVTQTLPCWADDTPPEINQSAIQKNQFYADNNTQKTSLDPQDREDHDNDEEEEDDPVVTRAPKKHDGKIAAAIGLVATVGLIYAYSTHTPAGDSKNQKPEQSHTGKTNNSPNNGQMFEDFFALLKNHEKINHISQSVKQFIEQAGYQLKDVETFELDTVIDDGKIVTGMLNGQEIRLLYSSNNKPILHVLAQAPSGSGQYWTDVETLVEARHGRSQHPIFQVLSSIDHSSAPSTTSTLTPSTMGSTPPPNSPPRPLPTTPVVPPLIIPKASQPQNTEEDDEESDEEQDEEDEDNEKTFLEFTQALQNCGIVIEQSAQAAITDIEQDADNDINFEYKDRSYWLSPTLRTILIEIKENTEEICDILAENYSSCRRLQVSDALFPVISVCQPADVDLTTLKFSQRESKPIQILLKFTSDQRLYKCGLGFQYWWQQRDTSTEDMVRIPRIELREGVRSTLTNYLIYGDIKDMPAIEHLLPRKKDSKDSKDSDVVSFVCKNTKALTHAYELKTKNFYEVPQGVTASMTLIGDMKQWKTHYEKLASS